MSEARVEWLTVAGDPEVWRSIGLTVGADGVIALFGTCIRIVAPTDVRHGLIGWAFSGIDPTDSVAGFSAEVIEPRGPVFAGHPLGASQLDHVVIFTGDLDGVSMAVEEATGCERRRVREVGAMRQGFHRIGRRGLIVEVVEHGDQQRAESEMWGVVLIVDDLDVACELLGENRVSAPKAAVQPGRRIATVRSEVGLGTAVALMSA